MLWDSPDRILVAAGTAFGEIIYWSWTRYADRGSDSLIHRVFLGHEGSIFGVQISQPLKFGSDTGCKRLLSSCSDDRTIRIWDVSDVDATVDGSSALDEDIEGQRTRHTGFSNASFDSDISSSDCLAIGWGHISRVWAVRFLDISPSATGIYLLSSGEDATSRIWRLNIGDDQTPSGISLPQKLAQLDCVAHHSGKNIWATTIRSPASSPQQVLCGAADSKITCHTLAVSLNLQQSRSGPVLCEYTVEAISRMAQSCSDAAISESEGLSHKSSKMAEFFRSYAFVDDSSFLVTTNSGKVYLERLSPWSTSSALGIISSSELIEETPDLTGYSVCIGESSLGVAFVASSRGSIYSYRRNAPRWSKIHVANGKVGDMFVAKSTDASEVETLILLLTLVGQNVAQLLTISVLQNETPMVLKAVVVPISELLTGIAITSMTHFAHSPQDEYLLLGFRRGSVAAYRIPTKKTETVDQNTHQASLFRIIERAHGKEAVTSVKWVPSGSKPSSGYLLSVGRDSCIAIHSFHLAANSVCLVHNVTLPIGPNVEGLYFHKGHLLVYGFSSKKFVLYDTTTEEEVMSVDTGGAHRSWTFQPQSTGEGGGALVWTRASSMHIYGQAGSNHKVVRSGGHGREIKAVAASSTIVDGASKQLIATGAEDTDIRIFEYENGDLLCRSTLRKHTTGIQHLQWSDKGDYLFSSGGCEEFYIWRIRGFPAEIGGIGIVCEFTHPPESEHSDVRIMSFDVWQRGSSFVIAMVSSDSNIMVSVKASSCDPNEINTAQVYSYDPEAASKWLTLAKGVYFTPCLTQSVFISSDDILTAGTDGHAVLWSLPPAIQRPHASTPRPLEILTWKQPVRIHQNTSKDMVSHPIDSEITLIVSAGDDGSLAFLLATSSPSCAASTPTPAETSFTCPPTIANRAHASAVTACAILPHASRILILSSGNDQWVRLWEVVPHLASASTDSKVLTRPDDDPLELRRRGKIKTNVADVSSMAVLGSMENGIARVLICGVGMEVVRVELG